MLSQRILRAAIYAATLFVLGFTTSASAAPSPLRKAGETFEEALRRSTPKRGWNRESATNVAGPVADADWSRVPRLSGDALRTFRTVRDHRFLTDPSHPDFLRRPSWLYPPDGCYARAAAVVQTADRFGFERPAQLFAFGSLKVSTPNVPEGEVQWWYHVTAIYRDSATDRVVVFDPAIFPSRPMPVEDWLLAMVPTLDAVKIAVCAAEAEEPNANCDEGEPGATEQLVAMLASQFLPWEWDNLLALGRRPERELGDAPPWANSRQ